MKFILYILFVVLMSNFAAARMISREWTHEELYKEADLVAVLVAESISVAASVRDSNPNPDRYRDYIAHCQVLLVIKGDKTISKLDVPFFRIPDGRPEFNGQHPAPFTARSTINYLVYLNHNEDGEWVAVSGNYDAGLSIKPMTIMLHPEHLRLPSEGSLEAK